MSIFLSFLSFLGRTSPNIAHTNVLGLSILLLVVFSSPSCTFLAAGLMLASFIHSELILE